MSETRDDIHCHHCYDIEGKTLVCHWKNPESDREHGDCDCYDTSEQERLCNRGCCV
jgi:hypothetical protein